MNEQKLIPLQVLYNRRKLILLCGIVAALLSALGSAPYFITPVFKAEAVIYPPASSNARITADYDLRFGGDKEIEEHMQVLNSAILRDSMVQRFHLMEHYGISSGREDKMSRLYREYADNVKIERTQFNSIKITVFDTNPLLAASMANELVKAGDRIKSGILRSNLKSTYEDLKQQLLQKDKDIGSRMQEASGINGMKTFNELIITPGNYSDLLVASVEIQKLVNQERKARHIAEENLLLRIMSLINEKYELEKSMHQAIVNLNGTLTSAFVISPARVPDKKSFPVRWLLVLSVTFSSLFFSAAAVVLDSQWKRLKQNFSQSQ